MITDEKLIEFGDAVFKEVCQRFRGGTPPAVGRTIVGPERIGIAELWLEELRAWSGRPDKIVETIEARVRRACEQAGVSCEGEG